MTTGKPITVVHLTTIAESLGFLRGHLSYIASQGFDVHVVSSPGAALDEFAAQERVQGHAIEMKRAISPRDDCLAVRALWRLFRRLRPAIVHAHTPKAGLVAMMAAWLAGVRVRIYHVHGLPYETATGLRRRILMAAEFVSCLLSSRVLCVSPSVRAELIRHHLCSPHKAVVPHHGSISGIDARGRFNPADVSAEARAALRARYGVPSDAPVVAFVGRIVRDKGIPELYLAWKALREQFPNLHLLLVGAEEEKDAVPEEVASALRADPRVHLTGWVRDMPVVYAAMDILALPSHREGLPLVALEAAAMGVPGVVTSATGCIDAVVDGVTGTVVPVGDSAALAQALARYLSGPADIRRRHGEAGRERVLRDFCPEDVWEATHQEYVRLLAKRGLAFSIADGANP